LVDLIFTFLILDHFKATFFVDKVVDIWRGLGLNRAGIQEVMMGHDATKRNLASKTLIRGPTNSANNLKAEHPKTDTPLHLPAKKKKKCMAS
jgi:hypothetical protein